MKLIISKRTNIIIGLFLTLVFFLINFAIINDYGVTWDFTYHFNAGLWHLHRPLTDPNFIMGPSPPLSDILPALSHLLFFDKLRWLTWDAAYNFYSVFLGSAGIGIVYIMISEMISTKTAIFSALTLALLPRYFGHLHNNMKDIPQAVFFTLAVWLFWKLTQRTDKSLLLLVLSVLALALAINSKVNGIFVIIIAGGFLALNILKKYIFRVKDLLKFPLSTYWYFILAPLATLCLWWVFWPNPLDRLIEASHSYTTSTTNMPVLYFGNIFFSGQNIPWHYPLGILTATTPVLVLVFFLVGLIYSIKHSKKNVYLFILLWLFIPLSRYLKPHMIVIDDVRHFMESLIPFSIVAGIGVKYFSDSITSSLKKRPWFPRNFSTTLLILIIYGSYLTYQIIFYHPFETSYYGELVQGVTGARGKYDIEFWAGSYKKALVWLNKNAPQKSHVTVAMAPDIAKLYLRPDLTIQLNQTNLAGVGSGEYFKSDYTVILNRESFFSWYGVNKYIDNRTPIYSLKLHDVPLVSIYQNTAKK